MVRGKVGEDRVDWRDPPLVRWLGTITKPGTRYNYKSAFRTYNEYTGMTATQLIDEALEDARRDVRERKDVVLSRIIGFYNWLKKEYEVKSRGKGEHKVLKVGVSDNFAHMRVTAIRSFYATYDIIVRLKGRHRLPKPKVVNKRMIINAEQVKVLVGHARKPRDRAIILCNFQGGLDASTIASINYGEVKEGLAKNEHPLKLETVRPKTGVEFYTFFGRDAVEAIKAWLRDAEHRGIQFTDRTPLFLQARRRKGKYRRLTPKNVEDMMRETAIKAGFVDEDMNGKDFNPLGPHALRESFGSIMTNSGVPDTIVDFWLAHEIGDMAKAYKSVQYPSLRQMYLDREKLISISQPPVDLEEVERKVRVEIEDRNRQLQTIVNGVTAENLELKSKVAKLELEATEKAERLRKIEEKIEKLNKTIEKLLE